MVPRPVGGDAQQGDGIAAARKGQGDRVSDVGLKPGGQTIARPADPAGFGIAQPPLRAGGRAAGAAAQAKRVRISVARVRRAGDAASA